MIINRQIKDVEGVKLYYPFLRNNYGTKESLSNHIHHIKTYLLLVDSVVIPPSDFARGEAFIMNRNFICLNSDFTELIKHGKIIITTVDNSARDVADVIEYYSDKPFDMFPYSSMPVYYRDELFQREKYALHMIDSISSLNINDQDKVEFISWLNLIPKHAIFEDSVKVADTDKNIKNDILKHTQKAYHFGGAWGNDAIVPPVSRNSIEAYYNQFYSILHLPYIEDRFTQRTRKKISDISVNKLIIINNYLSKFHYDYYTLSKEYQKLSFKLDNLLTKDVKNWSLLKKLIYALVSVTLGLVINKLFSPGLIANPWLIITSGVLLAVGIELLKLGRTISDCIIWFFKKIGSYNACKDELLFALNEFDSSLSRIDLVKT